MSSSALKQTQALLMPTVDEYRFMFNKARNDF